jgi:CRP-like cAMP-binding protein
MINYKSINRESTFWSNLFKAPAERNDLEEVLLSMPPFKNLNSSQLKQLLKLVHNRVYSANEYIFYQGDPGIALYIIREGEVKVVKNNEKGNEMELARFGRGDFFGEMSLMDQDVRSASAIAVTDSKLGVIFRPDLDKYIEKFPKRGVTILRGLSEIVATRLRILDNEFITLYSNYVNKNEESEDGGD